LAYHSKRSKVYHTQSGCPVGKGLKKKNRCAGTGGKKMCNFCKTSGKGIRRKGFRRIRNAKKAKRRRDGGRVSGTKELLFNRDTMKVETIENI